jgi:putative salt-induced outer membrane protein YdiY
MPRFRAYPAALAFVALYFCCSPGGLRAEQLLLKNGDRLTGKVIKREDGKIYFRSDLLGDIIAPANEVTIVETPPPAAAQSLAGLPPQPVTAPAPATAPVIVPAATATPPAPALAVTPAPAAAAIVAPAPGAAAAASSAMVAVVPSRGPWWWPGWPSWPWVTRPLYILKPVITKWTGKVEFGYSNELSTVRTVSTSLRAQADRNVGPDEIELKGTYLYGSSSGIPTTDQDEIDFRWRHNLDERWFTQALTSYSSDKIRLINTDFEQTADLGYKLINDTRQTLDIGGGAMVQYFDATGVEGGSDYLGNAFQDYTYKINGRYTFTEDASIQYSPEDRGRNGVVADISTPINTTSQNYDYKFHATLQGKVTDHLSLNLHYDYEYDNAVLDPNSRADQHITATLGYGF